MDLVTGNVERLNMAEQCLTKLWDKICVCLPSCEMVREKEWLNGLTACQMDCDQLAVSQSCASSIWTNTFRNLDKYCLQF